MESIYMDQFLHHTNATTWKTLNQIECYYEDGNPIKQKLQKVQKTCSYGK